MAVADVGWMMAAVASAMMVANVAAISELQREGGKVPAIVEKGRPARAAAWAGETKGLGEEC